MKDSNSIVWFESNPAPPPAQISINKDGVISFGSAARKLLPEYVQFGFNTASRRLLLKGDESKQGHHVNSTRKKDPKLTIFLSQQGVVFPAVYCVEESRDMKGVWEGILMTDTENHLIREILKLAAEDIFAARSCDPMQSLLDLYRPKLRAICRTMAKTIPKDDRFQIAQEGFIQATLQYRPNLHIFSDHVMAFTKKYLKSQIPSYSGTYKEFYPLERILPGGDSYEVFSSAEADASFETLSHKLDLERRLTPLELEVYQQLSKGYTQKEILDVCQLTPDRYLDILEHIRNVISLQ